MDLLAKIDALIDEHHLLTHPFYTRWVAGDLPIEAIRDYARRYYAFESAFPRFLSAIHSKTERRDLRQHLLENLWDEEHGEENHAELWLRFAEAVGVGREDVLGAERGVAAERLVESYERAARSPVAGVAAIHAYERQVPAVARAKIDGLREHYGIEEGLTFWEVHERLDVEHAEAERAILAEVGADDPEAAVEATREALDAWWGFLDSVDVA
ncbi:MAG TPA: CADD family putative folate metabolism protein [Actinomycetota bacterium]|nr:CADD family putative folate metabolism protein [Actinomycetota bacterium]